MATPFCVHWDDVEPRRIDRGELQGSRVRLGVAAGAQRIGLSRYLLGPGERPMPVHVHADEEEIFYVLGGTGLSWQDGRTYRIGTGDTIVHRASTVAHTVIAGGAGLDVLAFGGGSDTHMTFLPRAGAWWMGPRWLPHDGPNPFVLEVAAGPLDVPDPQPERPPGIVALTDVSAPHRVNGDVASIRRDLGRAAGSQTTGLKHMIIDPHGLGAVPHCHSTEEELFVVLEGDGKLLLGDDEHAVRAGHVVARPPGTGVAHTFRADGAGLTLLAYGTRDPGDICFYPRSNKVSFRGIGVIARIERLDYWDGEA
jgi:uncharacterized cupin superfamily protein